MKTHEDFKNEMQNVSNSQLVQMLQASLSKLCSSGGSSFKMSIPPMIDDTDMLISEILKRFNQQSTDHFEVKRLNDGIKQIIDEDKDRPTHEIIEILTMLYTPCGEWI